MGAVSFSIDRKLVETIQNVLHARTFVETGTFEGDSVERVADLFENVLTVERSQAYYDASSQRFRDQANIHLAFGESPDFLREARDKIGDSAIFWLDAHWCLADSTSGEKSQCPLLAELEAIKSLDQGSVIMIDDARLFMAAPPKPHEITHWPTLSQVMRRLTKLSTKHSLMILNDVIIFYPRSLEQALREYSHEHSVDWLHILDESREYKAILEADRVEIEQLRPIAAEAETREILLNENDAAQRQLREQFDAQSQQVAELSAALEEARVGWTSSAEAAAERLQLLEAASAESEMLRPIAAKSQAREILLTENATALQLLFADLSERDARIEQLSAARDEAVAALEAQRTAAAERLELLERSTAENEQLRALAAQAQQAAEGCAERDRQIAELSAALEAQRSAAAERLELLERATAENELLRASAAETQQRGAADDDERARQIAELAAAAAERLELLERASAENERLRALAAEAQTPLIEQLHERDRQIAELRAALETERAAAAERLQLLEGATAELQQQIRHATERASIIDSLTAVVEEQQRATERGEGR